MALTIECQSTEFIRVRVVAKEAGSEIDPTGFPVEFAFVPPGETPDVGDWNPGEWETGGPPYYARFLFDASSYGEGLFQGWIRITAGSETVVKKVCVIEVCNCEEAS